MCGGVLVEDALGQLEDFFGEGGPLALDVHAVVCGLAVAQVCELPLERAVLLVEPLERVDEVPDLFFEVADVLEHLELFQVRSLGAGSVPGLCLFGCCDPLAVDLQETGFFFGLGHGREELAQLHADFFDPLLGEESREGLVGCRVFHDGQGEVGQELGYFGELGALPVEVELELLELDASDARAGLVRRGYFGGAAAERRVHAVDREVDVEEELEADGLLVRDAQADRDVQAPDRQELFLLAAVEELVSCGLLRGASPGSRGFGVWGSPRGRLLSGSSRASLRSCA